MEYNKFYITSDYNVSSQKPESNCQYISYRSEGVNIKITYLFGDSLQHALGLYTDNELKYVEAGISESKLEHRYYSLIDITICNNHIKEFMKEVVNIRLNTETNIDSVEYIYRNFINISTILYNWMIIILSNMEDNETDIKLISDTPRDLITEFYHHQNPYLDTQPLILLDGTIISSNTFYATQNHDLEEDSIYIGGFASFVYNVPDMNLYLRIYFNQYAEEVDSCYITCSLVENINDDNSILSVLTLNSEMQQLMIDLYSINANTTKQEGKELHNRMVELSKRVANLMIKSLPEIETLNSISVGFTCKRAI